MIPEVNVDDIAQVAQWMSNSSFLSLIGFLLPLLFKPLYPVAVKIMRRDPSPYIQDLQLRTWYKSKYLKPQGKELNRLITGRANYQAASDRFGVDFVNNPDWAASLEYKWRIAAWYCTEYRPGWRDAANAGDVAEATYIVNGGYTDLERREEVTANALEFMGAS